MASGPKSARCIGLPPICTLHETFAQSRVQPRTVTIFRGWTRLTTDSQGEMQGGPLQGFFAGETQYLTHYEIRINRQPVSHRLSAQLSSCEWTTVGTLLNSGDSGNLPAGTLPKGSIELRIIRKVDGGLTESIILRNNGQQRRQVQLSLRFCCPIRDQEFVEEMKQETQLRWTGLVPRVFRSDDGVGFHFQKSFGRRRKAPQAEFQAMYDGQAPRDGEPVTRGLKMTLRGVPTGARVRMTARGGKICVFGVTAQLGGREEARLRIEYEPEINGQVMHAPALEGAEPLPRLHPVPLEDGLSVVSSNSTLNLIVGQAMVDLDSMRLPVFGKREDDPGAYLGYSAGIPRYVGLFGRDNLVTAWQSQLLGSARIDAVLSRVALLQGVRREDWRDEEPDRLPHEQRLDPVCQTGQTNREIYYGDVTSTPFWVLTLSTLFQWTGDRETVRKHRPTLERCCDWIMRRLREGFGFIYYAPAVPGRKDANRNHAWKDSGDAIVDDRGRIRVPPLAVAEVQGYAYQALCEASELLRVLDERGTRERRARYLSEAEGLRRRFNERFWVGAKRFYALALDAHGRPVAAMASNIGHCLATGILDEDKIPAVVQGLKSDALFSGWGIRTLSNRNPGYDPFSYHRGAVWPVENAFIASGLRLTGYHDEAERLTGAQLALAALFEHMRLPEVFSGHARRPEDPVPGIYNFANLLQSWSVSAIAQHVQSILGVWPRADLGVLYLDPHLPDWLEWLELRDLKVGRERLSIRFERDRDGTSRWIPLTPSGSIELRQGPPSCFAPKDARLLKAG